MPYRKARLKANMAVLVHSGIDRRMTVSRARLQAHYDALGTGQDAESWYEDPAFDDLCDMCAFEEAASVVEIGCGTGRFARRLLDAHLPSHATYRGFDISAEMAALTGATIEPFGARAEVLQCDAVKGLPLAAGSADRVILTFVLDLLDGRETRAVLSEAARLLAPGGLLCAASLDHGAGLMPRLRSLGWTLVHRLRPLAVGGCRPIRLPERLGNGWEVELYVRRNIKNCAVASISAKPQKAVNP